MSDSLPRNIERIRSLAPRLNRATDDAHALVTKVEQFLNEECSIGLSVEVPIGQRLLAADARPDPLLALSYERVDGKYRIAVRERCFKSDPSDPTCDMRYPDGDAVWAWPSAPREYKLLTFPMLPRLLAGVASEAERLLAGSDETSKTVSLLLAAMKAPKTQT